MTETYDGGHAVAAKAESVPNSFYISATTSLLERRPRTLKHGDTFAVFDHYGDVSSRGGSPEGIFHKDTRFLSDLRVLVNGQRPPCSARPCRTITCYSRRTLPIPIFSGAISLSSRGDTLQIRSLKVSLRWGVLRAARRA